MKHKYMQTFTGQEPICDVCGKLFADENEECSGPPPTVTQKATITISLREYSVLNFIAQEAEWMHGQRMLMTRVMLDHLNDLKKNTKIKL